MPLEFFFLRKQVWTIFQTLAIQKLSLKELEDYLLEA